MLLRFTPWQSLPSWGGFLAPGNTARGEAVAVARHVGMPVDLEGEVGSSSQTDRSGLEIAGRGVQIDGLHVRQIGDGESAACIGSVRIVLAGNDGQVASA